MAVRCATAAGVRPEFEVEEPKMPTLMYYLAVDTILIDFVTDWTQQHKTIPPVEDFQLADEDFEAFKSYAAEKGFTYDRQSEKALKNLKEVAEFEGYLDEDSTLFKSLEEKLTPDLRRDFDRFKPEIMRLLSSEIVKRYYYQKGELRQNLKRRQSPAESFGGPRRPCLVSEDTEQAGGCAGCRQQIRNRKRWIRL